MLAWSVYEEETGFEPPLLFDYRASGSEVSSFAWVFRPQYFSWSVNEHGDKRPASLNAQLFWLCHGKWGWQHPAQPTMLTFCEGKGALLAAVTWFRVPFFLYHLFRILLAVTFATPHSLWEAIPAVSWNSSKLKLFVKLAGMLIYILYVLCTCSGIFKAERNWSELEFVQIKREIHFVPGLRETF